jgi:NRPS condensation-like uncharacterized protein
MRYPTEIFDLMQWHYEATGFNDHQVHCEIGLGSPLDETALRRAAAISLEAMPILATRYASSEGRTAWETLERSDLERAFIATEDEAAFESERTFRIREEVGPQVRFCLLRGKRNALAVTMNHMIADGAGFKDYLYSICETYSRTLRDPDGDHGGEVRDEPKAFESGDRGLGDVLGGFGPIAKAAAFLGAGGASNKEGSFALPLESGGDPRPFIATRTMPGEKVARLKAYCRARGATLNDAALAAYYRVLARRLGPAALDGLEIPIMVDMRRYLRRREHPSLRNLSSTALTRVRQREGESFEETLLKAKANMDALKRRRIGLGGFVKLSLLFSILGEAEAFRLLGRGLRNPLLCMTNLGELDSKRLAFEGARVETAYVCGSIKHKPHFQLALSGFAGTITLSSNLYGSPADRRTLDDFLREAEEELSV